MINIQPQKLQALRLKGYLWRNNNRGQSSLEYAVIIICISAGLLVMQPYIKKAFQGRLRQQADELGQQYDPAKTSGTLTIVNDNITKTISKTYDETALEKLTDGVDIEVDENHPHEDRIIDFKNIDKKVNGKVIKWCDLNEDGDCKDADVFATFTKSIIEKGKVTQDGTETIKP